MEVNGAIEMFSSANAKNGVTYINYVGNADCKTFKAITEINPGVTAKWCIDHVKKRMSFPLQFQ